MSASIHVVGSLMVDRILRVASIPRPGETVTARSARTMPGGKGANQAAAAARCGARVRCCGRTGPDGAFVVDALRGCGVDVGAVRTDDAMSGNASVMVADSGENAIVIAPEANARLEPRDVSRFLSGAAPGDLALFQNECAGLHAGIAAAVGAGLQAWLNAAPADGGLAAIDLGVLSGLVVNETEAEAMTGERDPKRALEVLAGRMPHGAVVVTLGAAGAIAAQHDARLRIPGHAVHAIDTVGCGDAFVGAMLAALAEGRGLEDALRWGNAAGALAAQREGAMPSLPTREAVLVLAAG